MSSEAVTSSEVSQVKRGTLGRWIKRILIALLALFGLLLALVVGVLLYFHVPSNSAGLAAQSVCSATFVAGRNDGQDVFTQDVVPQSPAFAVVSTSVDQQGRTVTAKFLGMFERRASLLPNRGCVLDEAPDPAAVPYTPVTQNPALWPIGDAPVPPADWGKGVDVAGLQKVVDQAFVGAGDPADANTRGVAVVHQGRLLTERQAPGFPDGTALLGWSSTKTVAAMLFYMRATETGFNIEQPVVNAFPAGREPGWVAQWRQDDRKNITVADVLFMRAGLDIADDYGPFGKVVQMLYGEPSMAGYAASQPLVDSPGSVWAYSTGEADILSQITQGMFASNEEYWQYPRTALFDPIGVSSATLATDTAGTWVGGSYLWADTGDWARLGQVMLADGKWADQQVFPPGWWKLAGTPAMADGDGHGYGAQTWIPGQPIGGECNAYPGVPQDTLSMEGHYGQFIGMIPSRDVVIVRLGWTIDKTQFDSCQLVSDVLATLPR